jgi:hypothetical protein
VRGVTPLSGQGSEFDIILLTETIEQLALGRHLEGPRKAELKAAPAKDGASVSDDKS